MTLTLSPRSRMLIVAAHPDDDILGCGGFLAKYAKLCEEVRVIFLGEGTTCRYKAEAHDNAEVLNEIENRRSYAIDALAVIGCIKPKFYDLPCGRFDNIPIIEIGKIVEDEISDFSPDIILTHCHVDVNNDHRLTHQAVLQATRPGAQNTVKTILCFEIPSSTEWKFTQVFLPQLYIDITQFIDLKIAAMKQYKSEMRDYPFPRSEQGLRAFAQYRGMQAGKQYAEAFIIVRSIVD